MTTAAVGLQGYDACIARKLRVQPPTGFAPAGALLPALFDWQKLVVDWALRRGRAALFEECGLGKTLQQLEWARQVALHTSRPVLILCPLAVASQTIREGDRFGIAVRAVRSESDVRPGINIANYERLGCFDPDVFGGVVLDESSILKGFMGRMRQSLNAAFRETPFRLACTATPAPNDFTELGQHADFLGVCTPGQMLATYFINDTFDTGTWRLKGHATEAFWRWVSSWAACVSRPSDLGFSDDGYELPPVETEIVRVSVPHTVEPGGELFARPMVSATEFHAEQRRTLKERVRAACDLVNEMGTEPCVVWCESNEESAALKAGVRGMVVEVRGSDAPEVKEQRLIDFTEGRARVIVTKPSIAGFGMNWQHCAREVYVGMNYSFERFYQAGKRIHRFGQKRTVKRYIVQADTENGVLAAIGRKEEQHAVMRELMNFTREALQPRSDGEKAMNIEIASEAGRGWELHHGDCVRVARDRIADESVGLSVFSPPFADLFTYSDDAQDMGNCAGVEEFMVQFGYLIDELLRVTMPGRECAVHCCDLLATKWKDGEIEYKDFSGELSRAFRSRGWLLHSRIAIWKDPVTEMQRTKAHGLLYKTLRSDSSRSRVGSADYLLVFRKRGENPRPIVHTPEELPLKRWQELASPVWMTVNQSRVLNGKMAKSERDERHICPLQLDVIERALELWSAPGDLVYSPFAGIGSEGWCAVQMGRRFVGSELKREYWSTGGEYLRAAELQTGELFAR